MFQFLVGFTTGVYVAQNYSIPEITSLVIFVRDKLTEYEKQVDTKKKNDK